MCVATPSAVVYFEYTTTRVLSDHTITLLTRIVILIIWFLKRYSFLLFVVGWSSLFFGAPSLAVFYAASVFNQDVSKWNTGAVTTMAYSKCTLLFRFVATRLHAFSLVVYFVNTYTTTKLESHQHRITLLTRFVALVFCGSETVPFSHVHVHVPFMLFCGLVSILFFVAPSLLLCSV